MISSPRIPRANKAAITQNPTTVAAGPNEPRSPRATSVAGSSTTTPALRSATNARKSPIPAAMPVFKPRGTEFTSHARTGRMLNTTNTTPDRNTIASAACQLTPPASTTV